MLKVVRAERFELPWEIPLAPKASVSASSTTPASASLSAEACLPAGRHNYYEFLLLRRRIPPHPRMRQYVAYNYTLCNDFIQEKRAAGFEPSRSDTYVKERG